MKAILVASVVTMALAGATAQANLLSDPSFEGRIVYGSPAFGGWAGFGSSAGTSSGAGFGTGAARTGSQQATLFTTAANHYAGIYQDVLIGAGSIVEFEIWHQAVQGSNGQGVRVRLVYRDSLRDVEIGRTPNAKPSSLGASYELFSITGVVPAGADTVRTTYAINSSGGVARQRLYLDDAALRVVPEPASLSLIGLVTGCIYFVRRFFVT